MATTVDVSQAKGERSYAATCHCKAMRLEVDALPERVTRCTCTNCAKRGGLWAYYKRADVRIVSDAQPHRKKARETVQETRTNEV